MSGFMTGTVVNGLVLGNDEEAPVGILGLVHGSELDVLGTGFSCPTILEDEASFDAPCCCSICVGSAHGCDKLGGTGPSDMTDSKASIS